MLLVCAVLNRHSVTSNDALQLNDVSADGKRQMQVRDAGTTARFTTPNTIVRRQSRRRRFEYYAVDRYATKQHPGELKRGALGKHVHDPIIIGTKGT